MTNKPSESVTEGQYTSQDKRNTSTPPQKHSPLLLLGKNQIIIAIIVGVVVGLLIGKAIWSGQENGLQKLERYGLNEPGWIINDDNLQTIQDDLFEYWHRNGPMKLIVKDLGRKNGAEFDRAFLKAMILNHEGALELAQLAIQNGSHQEITNLAQEILAGQTTQLEKMKAWLTDWFGTN